MRAQLQDYRIDPQRGFVPARDPLQQLPAAFSSWEAVVADLGPLIRSRKLRSAVSDLPVLDAKELLHEAERERSLLLLTVLGNAYVWGGESPNLRIPAVLARPLSDVAAVLDRPPLVHYASMALNNWRRLDPSKRLSADNATMQVQFLGGVDEDWFFMASIEVELAAAPMLQAVFDGVQASHAGSDGDVGAALDRVAAGMDAVSGALARMREWCDPRAFFLRVRPFLAGWPAPGVVYEGVSEEPRSYVGGSAGQSSIVQALDALLEVVHPDPTGAYLRALRPYMPVDHRQFVVDVERESRVRERTLVGSAALRAAYDRALHQVATFRVAHLQLAHDYIVVPSGMSPTEKGTGGTTLGAFLGSARNATESSRLKP